MSTLYESSLRSLQLLGQGKDNAREFLRENPDIAREIENRIRESLGVNAMPAGGGGVAVADEEK
jgi:recombination protein RecA